MCWGQTASMTFLAIGAAATVVTIAQRRPPAVSLALGYFAVMEGLQVLGYAVIDACGTPENQAVTLLSYLHIAFQPLVINAFALELVPAERKEQARPWVLGAAGMASLVMLLQLLPLPAAGVCRPGDALCGAALCTVSGSWHIAWDVPYNGLLVPLDQALGTSFAFPAYLLAVFALPLAYGAWRFVVFHALAGPVLALLLTSNPNEMPAVWCLFSIGIVLMGLSPWICARFSQPGGWARPQPLASG
jgi:hypothetical protein